MYAISQQITRGFFSPKKRKQEIENRKERIKQILAQVKKIKIATKTQRHEEERAKIIFRQACPGVTSGFVISG